MQVLLFFIIPIKVKYLAYVDAALFVLGVVTTSFPLNLLPVVAVLNYLVYCGDWLFDLFRPSHAPAAENGELQARGPAHPARAGKQALSL